MPETDGVLGYDADAAGQGGSYLREIVAHFETISNYYKNVLGEIPLNYAFGCGDEIANVLHTNAAPGIEALGEILRAFWEALAAAGGKVDAATKTLEVTGDTAADAVRGGGGRH